MSEPTSTNEPSITLYRLQACPFCKRFVRKFDEYNIDYHSRFVKPMDFECGVDK